MESTHNTNMTSRNFCIDPREIVRRIETLADGYGLDESMHAFKETERVMGFLPWWEAEVSVPVMKFFKEERARLQTEKHAMELDRLRAGATNVSISQPQAHAGIELPYGVAGIGQVNMGDKSNPIYYSESSQI